MGETSILWLRVAVALYSLALLESVSTLSSRRGKLLRPALGAFALGSLFHLVSIVEQGLLRNHFPANNLFESMSLCAFLVAAFFLFAVWRYQVESLRVFVVPLVFLMALVAALSEPVASWSSPTLRTAWLIVHVVTILLGYAALSFTAVAAVAYLAEERKLKQKRASRSFLTLPPLGTLDQVISKSLAVGFAFLTVGVAVGSIWAFVEFGTRWVASPPIAISFATWGVCLALVFFRVNAGWRGRKAAILSLLAIGCLALTWLSHERLRYLLPQ